VDAFGLPQISDQRDFFFNLIDMKTQWQASTSDGV